MTRLKVVWVRMRVGKENSRMGIVNERKQARGTEKRERMGEYMRVESTVMEGTAMRKAAKSRSGFRFRFAVEVSQ